MRLYTKHDNKLKSKQHSSNSISTMIKQHTNWCRVLYINKIYYVLVLLACLPSMLSRCWYKNIVTAMRMHFHGGNGWPNWSLPQKINTTCEISTITNAISVIRFGAIHMGVNFSSHSANGDHKCSYVMLEDPPWYLNYFKLCYSIY